MPHRHKSEKHSPHWHALADRFPGERDCLASFLALELAEVLAGEKPANLLRLSSRRLPCGRNLLQLWDRFGAELMQPAGMVVRPLRQRDDSILLLFYRPAHLQSLFDRKNVQRFLSLAGYPAPVTVNTALAELASRFQRESFPHEIGVFLGYPLKDVAGFIGWAPLPFTCQGPWKIFGNPVKSLGLVETYRRCRHRMAERLTGGARPLDCLVSRREGENAVMGSPSLYPAGGARCAWR